MGIPLQIPRGLLSGEQSGNPGGILDQVTKLEGIKNQRQQIQQGAERLDIARRGQDLQVQQMALQQEQAEVTATNSKISGFKNAIAATPVGSDANNRAVAGLFETIGMDSKAIMDRVPMAELNGILNGAFKKLEGCAKNLEAGKSSKAQCDAEARGIIIETLGTIEQTYGADAIGESRQAAMTSSLGAQRDLTQTTLEQANRERQEELEQANDERRIDLNRDATIAEQSAKAREARVTAGATAIAQQKTLPGIDPNDPIGQQLAQFEKQLDDAPLLRQQLEQGVPTIPLTLDANGVIDPNSPEQFENIRTAISRLQDQNVNGVFGKAGSPEAVKKQFGTFLDLLEVSNPGIVVTTPDGKRVIGNTENRSALRTLYSQLTGLR